MTLLDRYKAFPRATQWALIAAAVVALYFGVIERVMDWSNAQRSEAAALEKSLADRARLAQEQESSGGQLERSIVAFGAPKEPVAMNDPEEVLTKKVESLAKKHEVTIKRRQPRHTQAVGLEWNGAKIDRVQLEVTIECDAVQFVSLLKELEASPEISSVVSVRMQKVQEPGGNKSLADSTLMQITLVPEVWTFARVEGRPAPAPAPAAEPAPAADLPPEVATEPMQEPAP